MAPNDITDEVETPSAAAKVFGTFELLEAILIHVGTFSVKQEASVDRARNIRDLYRCQQVNKTFRGVISSSRNLRELMFRELKETGSDNEHNKDDADEWDCYLNPYARMLHLFIPGPGMHFKVTCLNLRLGNLGLRYKGFMSPDRPARPIQQPGSWRQMLITSTPIRFYITVVVDIEGLGIQHGFELREGASLGELSDIVVDKIEYLVENWPWGKWATPDNWHPDIDDEGDTGDASW